VLAREALAHSLNIPSVDAVAKIGPPTVVAAAKRLGISSLSHDAAYNLSIALGTEGVSPLELTAAYAAFSNDGIYNQPKLILDITDKHGRPVPTPERHQWRAVSSAVAFLISSILSDNESRYTTFGRSLVLSRPAAAKTGTTQDFRDAWTVGYTPNLAVGIWIGNNDNAPMHTLPGASGAAPLWRLVMETFSKPLPVLAFDQPTDIVSTRVCRSQGLLASGGSGYIEYFIRGTEPTAYCPQPTPKPEETEEKNEEENSEEKKKEESGEREEKMARTKQDDTKYIKEDFMEDFLEPEL
ncbi:MAG: penicillin-binding transpeptidase domain-containing protein, partial [Candidatus Binatia bacterium]